MPMQALILAAGRGSRLGSAYGNIHKCLLEVGRRALIEHQLETLAEAGVGPVAVVVGYSADEVRAAVGNRAETILNPRWRTTNSLYSFSLARDWVKGPLVVLNCDILIHPRILDRLLARGGDCLAFDGRSGQGREHMKVELAEGRLKGMGKDLPLDRVSGENVGAICLSEDGARDLLGHASRLVAAGKENEWLGLALRELAQERAVAGVDVGDLPWGEVDFPFDLERVRSQVWPRIRRDEGRRPIFRRALTAAALCTLVLGGLVTGKGCFASAVELDTVEVSGVPAVRLNVGPRQQAWWEIDEQRPLAIPVVGPTQLQIETRLGLGGGQAERVPAVVQVALDDERVDWFKLSARLDRDAHCQGSPVTKRGKLTIEVPPGRHWVQLSLVATAARRCFVRVRQPDQSESDS